ncbi:2OG-Fe(II) oxygenase [Kordiimonas sp.]|uniref:2OG-Fe(II) oxygenase n=1 Tax=Kordiimonas sp. TaxID=1970157 RepID=UPI003A8FC236
MSPRGDAPFLPHALIGSQAKPSTHLLKPYVDEGFLSADECAHLRALATAQAASKGRLAGGVQADAVRSVGATWLDDTDEPWLAAKFARALSQICANAFPFDIDGFDEGFQLLRYEGAAGKPGDFYDWHADIGRAGSTKRRKLSLVVQLSDPSAYEGGELTLNPGGSHMVAPKGEGTLIAFPSFVLHQVTPLELGERVSLAAWAHGPAFR